MLRPKLATTLADGPVPRHGDKRGYLLSVVAIMIGLALSLLIVEAALRLLPAQQELGLESFSSPDAVLNHYHRPGFHGRYRSLRGEFDTEVTLNSRGLRDREYSISKPPGTFRILVLGDSMVEAAQVALDETFVKLVEQRLNQTNGHPFEVLNAGVASFSPALEYLFLKTRGLEFQPDVVIVVFFANDVTDDYIYTHHPRAVFDEQGLPVMLPSFVEQQDDSLSLKGLLRYFATYRFLSDKTFELCDLCRRFGLVRPRSAYRHDGGLKQNPLAIFDPAGTAEDEEAWNRTLLYLEGIHRLAASAGAQTALVVMPFPAQVSEKEFREGKRAMGLPGTYHINGTAMQERLASFSRKHSLWHVDLLPVHKTAAASGLLYLAFDGHLNAAGHRVTAEALYESLISSPLLPDGGVLAVKKPVAFVSE